MLRFMQFAAVILVCAMPIGLVGQDQPQPPQPGAAAETVKRLPAPAHYYRLDFVMRESDQGKLLSQRSFSLGVSAPATGGGFGEWFSLRAGTRVPVNNNYLDVGFNVDGRAEEAGNALQLRLKADLSSLPPDGAAAATASSSNNTVLPFFPPIRQMKVDEAVSVPIGKPALIFSAEDPNSKHLFQIEVTAVPQK